MMPDPLVERLEEFLQHGVPAVDRFAPQWSSSNQGDVSIPVAVWRNEDVAAVLYLEQSRGYEELDARVDTFAQNSDRGWILEQSTGGSWIGGGWGELVASDTIRLMGLGASIHSLPTDTEYFLVGGRVGSDDLLVGYRGERCQGVVRASSDYGVFLFGLERHQRIEVGSVGTTPDSTERLLESMRVKYVLDVP